MHAIRTIRVVLGEGQPGLLRLVLEAQGFEVVGHARDDHELLRILDLTSPSVVVLDAGISAIAAGAVESRAGGAPIVLVWPRDVLTSIAAERVEPASAILELGNAVRRAAERRPAEEVIRVPEASATTARIERQHEPTAIDPTAIEPASPEPGSPGRTHRATRHVLVAVTAWVLSLTALGAIGVALPGVFGALDRPRAAHPSAIDRADRSRVQDRERSPAPEVADPDDETRPDCADRDADPEAGRGKGCGQGKAQGAAQGKAKGNGPDPDRTKPDKGRPDEPGKSGEKGKSDQEHGSNAGHGGGPGEGGRGSSGGSDGTTEEDDGTPTGDGQAEGEDSGQGGGRGQASSDGGGGGPADPPGGGKPSDSKGAGED